MRQFPSILGFPALREMRKRGEHAGSRFAYVTLRDSTGNVPLPVAIGMTLARRIEAIFAYRSQIPVIFRFTADMPGTVSGFARKIGGPLGPAERFWPILGAAAMTIGGPNVHNDTWQIA